MSQPVDSKEECDSVRPDLVAVLAAKAETLDEARPQALAKRARTGHWTDQRNIDALLDPGSFQEYGQLARPAFKQREGAADGLVAGTGMVDGERVTVAAYDYMMHAGTQSIINHAKADRLLNVVHRLRPPAPRSTRKHTIDNCEESRSRPWVHVNGMKTKQDNLHPEKHSVLLP